MGNELEKDLAKKLKDISKQKSFKMVSISIYQEINDLFVFCTFGIAEKTKIVYRICAKKLFYDDLFWQIMHIEGKITPKLRAEGAFAAPSVELADGFYLSTGNIENDANVMVEKFEESVSGFAKSKYLEEKIWGNDEIIDQDILRCLEYINSGDFIKAKDIASKSIKEGYNGRFVIGGKGFFEWVMIYGQNQCDVEAYDTLNVEKTDVIDSIGFDKESNTLALLLADGMDWLDERKHLKLLDRKIKNYFTYIETKQFQPKYKSAERFEIQIKFLFKETSKCARLISKYERRAHFRREKIAINIEHGTE